MNPKFGAKDPSPSLAHDHEFDQYLNSDSQLLRLREENYNLRTSLKELQSKFALLAKSKESEVLDLQARFEKAQQENSLLVSHNKKYEAHLEFLQKKLLALENSLKSQIQTACSSREQILEEVAQIEDPFALVLINKLLFSPAFAPEHFPEGRTKPGRSSKQAADRENLLARNSKLAAQCHRLQSNCKELGKEVSILQTQNQFLLKQYEFAEKQLVANGLRPDFGRGQTGGQAEDLQDQVCSILGISADKNLPESLAKIARAYKLVPLMSETLEQIFEIVTENDFMPMHCGSPAQLIEVLENWVGNLRDYQNLVTQLFEILNIQEETLKNRTHLITSIKDLVFAGTKKEGILNDSLKSDKENLRGGQNEMTEELRRLKKQISAVEFFCEEAKRKMRLPVSYSKEALFAKILRVLDDSEAVKEVIGTNEGIPN